MGEPTPVAAMKCLEDEIGGGGAELIVTALTVEGDPVTTWFRALPTGGMATWSDVRQDKFAGRGLLALQPVSVRGVDALRKRRVHAREVRVAHKRCATVRGVGVACRSRPEEGTRSGDEEQALRSALRRAQRPAHPAGDRESRAVHAPSAAYGPEPIEWAPPRQQPPVRAWIFLSNAPATKIPAVAAGWNDRIVIVEWEAPGGGAALLWGETR